MAQVEIVNRSTMIDKLHAGLVLRPRETAILTIDMHRGHLDPAVATAQADPDVLGSAPEPVARDDPRRALSSRSHPVSYTHLTLPTILRV